MSKKVKCFSSGRKLIKKPDNFGIMNLPLGLYFKVVYENGGIHVCISNQSGYEMKIGPICALYKDGTVIQKLEIDEIKMIDLEERTIVIPTGVLEKGTYTFGSAEHRVDFEVK